LFEVHEWDHPCRNFQPLLKGISYLLETKAPQVSARGVWVLVSQHGLDMPQTVPFPVKDAGCQVADSLETKRLNFGLFTQPSYEVLEHLERFTMGLSKNRFQKGSFLAGTIFSSMFSRNSC
jgi:hypothetical protein